MFILGVSAYYHDSAACIIRDGAILAAAQEERFTRKKHDPSFPAKAIAYCLKEAGITVTDLHAVVFYEKPFLKFERLLETYLAFAPRGFLSFVTSMPLWAKEKLLMRSLLQKEFKKKFGGDVSRLLFSEHHEAHAASAFYPSPFAEAAVLCLDGVGEWSTTTAWHGRDSSLSPIWEIRFPHSLGLLYSAFTYYTGFKVNSGEYKVMGLAPYGRPVYVQKIKDALVDIKPDGTFQLNIEYFNYCTGLTMTGEKFHQLFGGPPRKPESPLTQKEMDLACSIQKVTEEIVIRLAASLRKETGCGNLCLSGGVALNCVANGLLQKNKIFDNIWIQPAAGDAGGALGAALAAWYTYYGKERVISGKDSMAGSYLGPAFSNDAIAEFLEKNSIPHVRLDDDTLMKRVSDDLAMGKVVGWFQGRMEYGPRALGSRSIIGDARSATIQSTMNLKIKFRESFRPFAPAVLRERVAEYFDIDTDSPYMLLVADVKKSRRISLNAEQEKLWGIDLLNVPKSDIPAVTHVDHSARIQTVHRDTNPRFYRLIGEFEKKTGCAVIVNTSFNVRGEPIVCSPQDAYQCFMRTDMDTLVMENCVLDRSAQPKKEKDIRWMQEFELD